MSSSNTVDEGASKAFAATADLIHAKVDAVATRLIAPPVLHEDNGQRYVCSLRRTGYRRCGAATTAIDALQALDVAVHRGIGCTGLRALKNGGAPRPFRMPAPTSHGAVAPLSMTS